MAIKPVKVGVIGAGVISYTYLYNLIHTFSITEVVGISSFHEASSERKAGQFGIRKMTNEQIINDPQIELIVNITPPTFHYQINKAALLAGKHVYSEKMMGVNLLEARELYDLAREKDLRYGQAPDTILGGGLQTVRKLLDSGFIGVPVMAQAMVTRGYRLAGEEDGPLHFAYGPGSSIPYDMGCYYVHALVSLLGPVMRVTGFSRACNTPKIFENPRHPRYKTAIDLIEPNVMVGSMEFVSGCVTTITALSECHIAEIPRLEIYGTEGVLICPDPNTFGGPVYLMRAPAGQRYEIPLTHGYRSAISHENLDLDHEEAERWAGSCRGIGAADLSWAIRNNRPHRCSAEMGLHACEIIHGIKQSSDEGSAYTLTSRPERPAALPSGYMTGKSVDEACLDHL